MYPSEEFPTRGVFIRTIEEGLISNNVTISKKVVLSIINVSIFRKIIEYILFYYKIVYVGFSERNKYDAIYVHFGSLCALPVLLVKVITRKKVILNVHGSDIIPIELTCRIALPLTRIFASYVELIVAPSLFFEKATQRLLKNKRKKIFVSPSGGIDLNVFKPMQDKENIRKKYRIKNNEFVVGYVSRIDEGKGWNIFLDIIHELSLNGLPVKGLMVGTGEQVNSLHQKIRHLNIDKNVTYLGSLEHRILPEIFNCMDCFLFPTLLSESFGLVSIEAMACGIVVVASKIGALPEYIENGQNGFLFSPGNVEEAASVIMKVSSNVTEHARISRNALKTGQKFDRITVASELKKQINAAIYKTN